MFLCFFKLRRPLYLFTLAVLESSLASICPHFLSQTSHIGLFPSLPSFLLPSLFSSSLLSSWIFQMRWPNPRFCRTDINHLDIDASQRDSAASPAWVWQVNKQPWPDWNQIGFPCAVKSQRPSATPSCSAELLLNGSINQKSALLSRY